MSFKEAIKDENWKDFDEFIVDADIIIENDIRKTVEKVQEYKKYLVDKYDILKHIKGINEEDIFNAQNKLYSGQVVAVDGTLNTYPLITGVRCRIGIVATSYKNKIIERVFYISEREFAEKAASSPEHFFELIGKKQTVSNLFLQSIMSYKEREISLKRPEEWKFIHGTLVPLELRVPRLGKGAFEAALNLSKKLLDYKKCVGVISSSTRFNYIAAGLVLNPGQYMWTIPVGEAVAEEIEEAIGNARERKELENFKEKYLDNLKLGVFRIGPKPYLFEAHEEYFDEAASLVIADSLHQQLRGFPLLIDYADSICKSVLSPDDFSKTIDFKLASLGGIPSYGFEVSERLLRRR